MVNKENDGHFIDDPVLVSSVKPDFSNMGIYPEVVSLTFADFFKELCALAPSPSDSNFPIVVHFIGDPLDREFFVKDIKRLNKEVLIRVGL